MKSDKQIKKEFLPKFWANPDKYYATDILKEKGFIRNICTKCNKPFWGTDEKRTLCGDPACSNEGFDFIGNSPAKRKLDYVEVRDLSMEERQEIPQIAIISNLRKFSR